MDDDLDLDLDATRDATEAVESSPKRSIDKGVLGGLIFGFGALLVGLLLEGSSPGAYFKGSAAIIVFGGTAAATLLACGWPLFRQLPAMVKHILFYEPVDRSHGIKQLVNFAERARREGLLVLEDDLQNVDDEFLRRGVQLVVDGTDPELVKEILQTEVDSLAEQNEAKAGVWTILGGFSPTLGIIGTVMGLVHVLANLENAAALGASISTAFIATFYGVAFANLLFLPIGLKLTACSDDEIAGRELMIEGILAIQSGDNPRIVEEKLVAFLDKETKLVFLEAKRSEREQRDDEFDLAA